MPNRSASPRGPQYPAVAFVSVPDISVTPSDSLTTRQPVASGALSAWMVTVMVLQVMAGDGVESSCTGAHSANVDDSDEKRCTVDRSEPATRAAPAVTLTHAHDSRHEVDVNDDDEYYYQERGRGSNSLDIDHAMQKAPSKCEHRSSQARTCSAHTPRRCRSTVPRRCCW